MSIKAIHQEALDSYAMCFTISLNIITFQFFIISVSCFVVFCSMFENNCPGGGVSAGTFCPRGRGFALSLCPGGWGIRPLKKLHGGVPRGEGMVRLGID